MAKLHYTLRVKNGQKGLFVVKFTSGDEINYPLIVF